MWFPTTDELIDMHDRIIQRTGGELGVLRRGAIEAAIERARWGPFQHGGGLTERAAYLLRGIAQDHPFVDGNKRTAFEAADLFLGENGYRLKADEDEGISFMVALAQGYVALDEVVVWIRDHSRRR